MLRALIVDDEEPARELLRAMLATSADVAVVAEASDGAEAIAAIRAHRPDVVLLDVQMPVLSGFDVIAALDGEPLPIVVFVTAYDQYALRAFEVSACDYLLKPFDAERLMRAMARVRERHAARDSANVPARAPELDALLSHVRRVMPAQLVVKVDGRHLFLDDHDIEWIEAVGKELRLHLRQQVVVVRESMTHLQQRLEPARFLRVHRAAIVNRRHIREVQPWFGREYVVITRSGARIVTGPTYRDAVQSLLARPTTY